MLRPFLQRICPCLLRSINTADRPPAAVSPGVVSDGRHGYPLVSSQALFRSQTALVPRRGPVGSGGVDLPQRANRRGSHYGRTLSRPVDPSMEIVRGLKRFSCTKGCSTAGLTAKRSAHPIALGERAYGQGRDEQAGMGKSACVQQERASVGRGGGEAGPCLARARNTYQGGHCRCRLVRFGVFRL
jgi:hypothetical protein